MTSRLPDRSGALRPSAASDDLEADRELECPVLTGFDPLVPEQVDDPGDWMAISRHEAPVFYMPKYSEWVVTRFEDCMTALHDTVTFSNAHSITVGSPPEAVA